MIAPDRTGKAGAASSRARSAEAPLLRVAIGFKCHSGWAVAVAVGHEASGFHLVGRHRVELIEPADAPWAKAPYHAAEHVDADAANALVLRAIRSARTAAERTIRVKATTASKVPLVAIAAKVLDERAMHVFGNASAANAVVATLGRSAGPPWGADQKSAALAAAIALAST